MALVSRRITLSVVAQLLLLLIILTLVDHHRHQVNACNEAICASIVSKCMLTQSCKCDHKTSLSCSKDCFFCLDYLYTECCSCVEMCPQQNETESELRTKSHVEELPESSPILFGVLTEETDRLGRWTSFTFPVEVSFVTSAGSAAKEIKFGAGTKVTMRTDGVDTEEDVQANCTVAYMSQCMSWNKCKSSCRSMGATSYRWFHDGCCECVGTNCINYGINESRCRLCPLVDVEENLEGLPEEGDLEGANKYKPEHESEFDDYSVGPGMEMMPEEEIHEEEHSPNTVKKPEVGADKGMKNGEKESSDIHNSVPKKPSL